MRTLIYGAGAIGGYLGAKLAQSGQPVALVARPDTADRINNQGLLLAEWGHLSTQHVPAYGSLREAMAGGSYDLVVLGMKSYDLAEAMRGLAAAGPLPPIILTTQNGIGVEEIVQGAAGAACVCAGAVTIPVRREAGNQLIVDKQGRGMGVAAVDAGVSAAPIADLLRRAGIGVTLVDDYRAMKWSKAVLNTMSNATSAILDMTPRELYRVPAIVKLESRMLRETLAVMDRLGLDPVDLPGAPVRWLARGIRMGPYLLMRAILRRGVAGSRGDKMPSFHMDLHSGRRRSEVIFHNGAIADAGEAHGVAVPVNRTLNEVLMQLVRGERDPAWYAHRPERLMAEIGAAD
jgi:2-dehydropantoate 2-reductase